MLRLLASLLAPLLIAGLGLVLTALEGTPALAPPAPVTAAERGRAVALLDEAAGLGERAVVTLTERELTVVANLALPRVIARLGTGLDGRDARAGVTLAAGAADLTLAVPLAGGGHWLNLRATLIQTEQLPKLKHLRLGGLPLPAAAARRALAPTLEAAGRMGMVRRVAFAPGEVRLGFGVAADSADPQQQLIQAAQVRLAALVAGRPRGPLGLSDLLTGLLADPEAPPAADPVAAHRAALIALAGFTLTGRLPPGAAAAAGVKTAGARRVVLLGREDLAKHYMLSAALAVGGGSGFSGLVGLAKEFDDAERGSGFSFADLTANRAGIRLAKLATRDDATARHVRARARAGLAEAALMPAIDGLPEGIDQYHFDRDFGGGHGVAYTRLVEHIDRRIEALALFRGAAAREDVGRRPWAAMPPVAGPVYAPWAPGVLALPSGPRPLRSPVRDLPPD